MKFPRLFIILSTLLLSSNASAGLLAVYQLTINNDWSAATHPANFPSGAHFSWLGGGTHNSNVTFWEQGGMASTGVIQMAETGVVEILVDTEFQQAVASGNAFSETIFEKVWTPEVPPGPGTRITSFNMDSDFPLITLATMLGPSPDWFVGVSNLVLFENGQWKDTVTVELALFDGGSEDGNTPTMSNPATAVQEAIQLITYDQNTGTYIPTSTPHYVGSMVFERVTPVPLPPSILYLLSAFVFSSFGFLKKKRG